MRSESPKHGMGGRLARRLAARIPAIRRLVDSRRMLQQRVIELQQNLMEPERRQRALEEHYQYLIRLNFHALLSAIPHDVLIGVVFNGISLRLPAGTLLTMSHCIHTNEARELTVLVETAHLAWMIDHLAPGGTFLDVGAATGATSIPIACEFRQTVKIIAYEPARRALRLLRQTIEANGIAGIDIRELAVSDAEGTALFREFMPDEEGTTPWRPEASSLVTEKLSGLAGDQDIEATVVTLDANALPECAPGPIVVKIDVEGFEVPVLRGAKRLLRERRPFLSIDIHRDPFRMDGTMTGPEVERFLGEFGYRFTMLGHVLLCEP
jgi:FkbM family methyltransferase